MTNIENDDSMLPIQNQTTAPETVPSRTIDQYEEKTAGFWVRFWALGLDTLIVSAIVGILVNPIFHLMNWSLSESSWYAPMTIVSGVFYYAYLVITTKFWQQTVGKMVFGLKVKTTNNEALTWSTVIFREVVGRFINNTIPVIYLMVAFMPKNKSLQDVIADTVVIHEKIYIKNEKIIINEYPKVDPSDSENSASPTV